eukprot:gene7333-7545_t
MLRLAGSDKGERIFFEGTAYLPKDTPLVIKDDRQAELKALRGEGGAASEFRTYKYKVYDDLGPNRPNLGGNTTLPYPRRLDIKAPGKDNLPFDEQFNYSKSTGFTGDTLAGVAVAFTQTVAGAVGEEPAWYNLLPLAAVAIARKKLGVKDKEPQFKKFEDIMTLFKKGDQAVLDDSAAKDINSAVAVSQVGLVKQSAMGKTFQEQEDEKKGKPFALPTGGLKELAQRALGTIFKDSQGSVLDINNLLAYTIPKVELNRSEQWATDLEFGRQVLAGMNPCMLTALKTLPNEVGSAIEAKHVDEDLQKLDPQGRGLQQLVADAAAGAKPHLYIIDYWVLNYFFAEFAGAKDRCEHVGRCIFYLQEKDGKDVGLLPVAIELANRQTINGKSGIVYSRAELTKDKREVLWRLAKATFRSVDSGFHQLVSHWLRCHACLEPFLIALRRNVSIMHPVAKLMIPHFRYTLHINCNARTSLINEGGTIESGFTPGPYAIRLSSAAYRFWRFSNQALPNELKSRGVVSGEGKLWLDDYPYAQDGLDIWNAFLNYFTSYLKLYYKSSEEVQEDEEIQAWWKEVKEQGHPDVLEVVEDLLRKGGLDKETAKTAAEQEVWGFSGPIPTIDALAWICTTIAWTASGHHAAVNFGQYDYSGLMLNVSSCIRRPIPKPDDASSPAFKALVDKTGDAQEGELLTYLCDFTSTLKVMTTVKLLSGHADDEQTLNEPNDMITDPDAVALNKQFINTMEALEMRFLNRNRNPANWTRSAGKKEALEYTLLYPSSKPGVTMRGVPYSVSI